MCGDGVDAGKWERYVVERWWVLKNEWMVERSVWLIGSVEGEKGLRKERLT